jgi:hypothetical protein
MKRKDFYPEQLREIRLSFNLALICTGISAALIFTAIILLFLGKIPSSLCISLLSAPTTRASVVWFRLWREAKRSVDDEPDDTDCHPS